MPVTVDNVDKSLWVWKNFKPSEIACPCCGELSPNDELSPFFIDSMNKIQKFRDLLSEPVVLNSAHRCVKHNADPKVGGEKTSMHLQIAFDIRCAKKDQSEYIKLLDAAGFSGIGLYNSFVHADLGRRRWWNYTTLKNNHDTKIIDFLMKRGK